MREYNKLIRDKIPEMIKKNGETPIMHIAEEGEYEEVLTRKLHEEVSEFLEDPSVEEAADILEVLHAICALKRVSLTGLEVVRQKKTEERGSFKNRIILDGVE